MTSVHRTPPSKDTGSLPAHPQGQQPFPPVPSGAISCTHHRDSSWQPGSLRLSHSSRAPSSSNALPTRLSSLKLSLALRMRQRSLQPSVVMAHSQSLGARGQSLQGHGVTLAQILGHYPPGPAGGKGSQPGGPARECVQSPARYPQPHQAVSSPQGPEPGAGAQQPRAQVPEACVAKPVAAQVQLLQ